jgi:hypothetical protein
MIGRRLCIVTLLSLIVLTAGLPAADNPESLAEDQQVLKEAGVGTDVPSLQAFFRQRIPTEADRKHLAALVTQLGSTDFEEREKASQTLAARGAPAVPYLRAALGNADAEIVRRARHCLEQIASGPGSALPMAAARLLARAQPAGAVALLLDYLPHVEEEAVQSEVLSALMTLTQQGGKPDPVLREALRDAQTIRRSAAAYVLGHSGEPTIRAAVRALLADPEVRVRFQAAQGLLEGNDRQAVPALIALVRDGPVEMSWQAESLLFQLGGERLPLLPSGDGPAERNQRKEAWTKWWQEQGDKIDLTLVNNQPRFLGLTLVPEMHASKVWECGRDGKPLWQVDGLACPIDAQVLPGGRLLVAELNGHKVTERDRKGRILWEKAVPTPIACQRLANGHTFIGTNHRVFIVTRDGKEVWSYTPEMGFFIHSVQRMSNGHVVCVSMDGVLREIDTSSKVVRSLSLPIRGGWAGVESAPGARYLAVNITEGKVLEIDAAGKVVWEHVLANACYASRLPNGNTLVVSNSKGLVEVDRSGKTVWEKAMPTAVWRAHRR